MKKALVMALALTALAAPIAQADEMLQVETVVTFDGKVSETFNHSVESGKSFKIPYTKSTEWVSGISKGVVRKESREVGFSASIGPRVHKDGTVSVSAHVEYATVTGTKPFMVDGTDYPQPVFWSVKSAPTPRKGTLGEPIELWKSNHRGHEVNVVVTVTNH